ncbi:MAG TPA: 50S ribosomal protein L21 [Dehalococcoidia bacterium]|jgi:large subunit ribosomal protein L21|nr:50S ribosomal protein L21 [Dehalococcoidia bacterium]
MYAVIRSGGKQYTVREGDTLDVELLKVAPGEQIELADVLLVGEGDEVTIGQPLVDEAKVVADVVEHGRGEKVIVFKYKPKTRYRRKAGHRQGFTRLAIREIVAP